MRSRRAKHPASPQRHSSSIAWRCGNSSSCRAPRRRCVLRFSFDNCPCAAEMWQAPALHAGDPRLRDTHRFVRRGQHFKPSKPNRKSARYLHKRRQPCCNANTGSGGPGADMVSSSVFPLLWLISLHNCRLNSHL